jgi:GAG-pre-integrase domain
MDLQGQVLAVVQMAANRNYTLKLEHVSHQALQLEAVNESTLWHKRYGHLNYKSLNLLQTK